MARNDYASYGNWQEHMPAGTAGREGGKEPEALAEAYRELGRQYYEGRFEDPLPELLPLFDSITRLRRQAEAERHSFCPQCGKPVKAGSRFCGTCGCQLS